MSAAVRFATVLALGIGVGPAQAQDAATARFSVEGDRAMFDTVVEVDGRQIDIRQSDVAALRDLLRDNAGVKTLVLTSNGGGHYPAMDLAELVIDFELDTHVDTICESSCVPVFLAGTQRTMARGARIGFHQLYWNAKSVEEYYTKHRDRRDWDTPFEFAEWMYRDTQTETYNRLTYMVERGVDPVFAIQSLRKPDTTMWYPYRAVLMAAGVLTK